jgi:hypothetical protein
MAEARDRSARCRRAGPTAGAGCQNQGIAKPGRAFPGGAGRPRRDALDLPERSGARPPDADPGHGQPAGARPRRHPRRVLLTPRPAVSAAVPQTTAEPRASGPLTPCRAQHRPEFEGCRVNERLASGLRASGDKTSSSGRPSASGLRRMFASAVTGQPQTLIGTVRPLPARYGPYLLGIQATRRRAHR